MGDRHDTASDAPAAFKQEIVCDPPNALGALLAQNAGCIAAIDEAISDIGDLIAALDEVGYLSHSPERPDQ